MNQKRLTSTDNLGKINKINFYGKLAEWSIAAVLKTVDVKASGGSNPSLSAIKITSINRSHKAKTVKKVIFLYLFKYQSKKRGHIICPRFYLLFSLIANKVYFLADCFI